MNYLQFEFPTVVLQQVPKTRREWRVFVQVRPDTFPLLCELGLLPSSLSPVRPDDILLGVSSTEQESDSRFPFPEGQGVPP